jgi:hypothetical protein
MQSRRVLALLVGALWLCSCDLIVDKTREGGATRPGGGGANSGPTPPPSYDGPVSPVPPRPGRCGNSVVIGDETTCKSQDEWKLAAYEACKAQNQTLDYYGVGGGDCGPGKTHQVKYQCCDLPPDPGGTPGTPPGAGTPGTGSTGPGGSCTGGVEGSDSSCKSAERWRQYAMENCARQNQALTEISLSDECGAGLYRYMKFVCCGK